MASLDSVKENIYSLVVKAGGRLTIDKILRWAENNNIGELIIALAIRDLEKSKRIKTSGEAKIVILWNLSSGTYRLTLPSIIETTTPTAKTTGRSTKVRTTGLISELLGLEEKKVRKAEKKEATTKTHAHSTESTQQQATVQVTETRQASQIVEERGASARAEVKVEFPVAQPKPLEKPVEVKPEAKIQEASRSSSQDVIRSAVSILTSEYGLDEKIAETIVRSILQYLGVNWSVGELRLRLDLSKMLSRKLDLDQETLFETIGRVLRVLRRLDVIEIVEPGIVNLLRRDLAQQQKLTFSEVLGL